jgi:hypothetical protein
MNELDLTDTPNSLKIFPTTKLAQFCWYTLQHRIASLTTYLTFYYGWVVYPAMGPCLTTCYFGYFSVPHAFSPPFTLEP